MSTNTLGPLVRLRGLRTEQLPAASASPDDLAPFLLAILQEAVPFIDSAAPKASGDAKPDPKIWKLKGTHTHPDSKAKVEVLERVIPAAELEKVESRSSAASEGGGESKGGGGKDAKVKGETWCCRRSVHADAAERGTASWEEFVAAFREEHAQSEKAFTPACLAAHEAQSWDCAGVEVEEGGVRWGRFKLVVEEMRHRIGKPVLKDRTFPVLQMTAAALGSGTGGEGGREFVVASIPVPDYGERSDKSKLAREKGAQVAFYVSVERIRGIGGGDGGQRKIEWLMATASDAAGVLPAWVQNLAAPAVIWKDVPLFLGWIARERGRRAQTKEAAPNGGGKKEEKAKSPDADGERAALPRVSSGVEVGSLPTVSEETSNDPELDAHTGPEVTTGVEVSQTAKVSGSA
ncbi:uncharacterized protein F4807DRAFT_409498 [Annulohypoxylon truncatum]|uniref:uncharacterized protein n=1 Tax=Annulohypoxylon truncatum TaxID=327061 RepID=UPI00200876EC|nr:uncharacterized protein F4807DRAFT_409498 [Annulohypoxylon truncatum]KAI1213880.1 hypothetical protein F4807DRAFT_409498 [Annulohypoxylon truncatum]